MKVLKKIGQLLALFSLPIKNNAAFFLFMYLLGVLCERAGRYYIKNVPMYKNTYLELFADLYVLCLLLMLAPPKIRGGLRTVLCVLFYGLAIIDVFCVVNFNSTITPTMLMLVGETNASEAGNFLSTYLNTSIFLSPVGLILLLIAIHVSISAFSPWTSAFFKERSTHFRLKPLFMAMAGATVVLLLNLTVAKSAENKQKIAFLFTRNTIGEVEHVLTQTPTAQLYMPIYRLLFSIRANHLTSKQLTTLFEASEKVTVDSCSYQSPEIVFIIGESANRHRSQLYGYHLPTTPNQVALQKTGQLTPFTNIVSNWNLTSYVFKNILSMYSIGEAGEWCDYPLFPQIFRAAGYHVTFLTNQFLPKAREAVYDFSGGFFLNNEKMSRLMFDTRNTSLHQYDEGLLEDFDQLENGKKKHKLTIFHLMGQHINYKQRFPSSRAKFVADNYDRPKLSRRQRQKMADYDNATLYNDSILAAIVQRYRDKDAIVVYMADHGEECYDDDHHVLGRLHSAEIDERLARNEFEIPFWIWCSKKYIHQRPEIFQSIKTARHRPMMTDVVPHLLLYLAGINSQFYQPELNILEPKYRKERLRMLKNRTDYDLLKSKKPTNTNISKS